MPDTPTLVELFGTVQLQTPATGGTIRFAGADGLNAVAANRLMSPPLAGVVRRVVLRTVTVDAADSAAGIDYFVELFGTRVAVATQAGVATWAAFSIGTRTLAPLIPTTALLGRTLPDLSQYVEWPYILENPMLAGGGVPANVPGLEVVVNLGMALPDGSDVTIGVGLLIESKMPNYPTAPFIQFGGTAAGAVWPRNT